VGLSTDPQQRFRIADGSNERIPSSTASLQESAISVGQGARRASSSHLHSLDVDPQDIIVTGRVAGLPCAEVRLQRLSNGTR
jgi:hypothetical protein